MRSLASFSFAAIGALAGERLPIYAYIDDFSGTGGHLPTELEKLCDAGVTTMLLAFYLVDNPGFPDSIADSVVQWTQVSETERKATMDRLHSKGCSLLVSSGGESEGTHWLDHDAKEYGTTFCTRAKGWNLDGVDFDKEGFTVNPVTIKWLADSLAACRAAWPDAIVTAAPQNPHLEVNPGWGDVYNLGAGYDRMLIQYYNQGDWWHSTTYEGLFTETDRGGINEMWARYPHVGKEVFVLGKPFKPEDANSAGFIEHKELRKIVCRAYNELGYRGGLMFWKAHLGEDYSGFTELGAPCDGSAPNPTTPPKINPTPAPPVAAPTTRPAVVTTKKPVVAPTTKPALGPTAAPGEHRTHPTRPTTAKPTTTPEPVYPPAPGEMCLA